MSDECDDECLTHADWCDGFCDHIDHNNACLHTEEDRDEA